MACLRARQRVRRRSHAAGDLGAPGTEVVGDLDFDRRELEADQLRAENLVEAAGPAAGLSTKDHLEGLTLSFVGTLVQ